MLIRAILFFVICYWIAARFADRIQKTLVGHKKMEDAQARTLRNWAMLAVAVLLAFATLHLLKIPLTVFAVLGGALAIGLGFGTQTLIKNFISGIIVLIERKVRVGDIIDADGSVGTVIEVNARSSVLRGFDGIETVIPNSVFLENRFTNWTLDDNKIRRSIRVGVAYGTQPKRVIEAIADEAGRHGLVCKDPAPMVVFEDFGDSSLVFCLYYWFDLHSGTSALLTDSDLRIMIEKRLSEMKIGIPFPQRDLHIYQDKPLQVEWRENDAPEAGPDPK
ncbi:MAG: mechanosensitive ion channel, partial [Verrucomicrobiae bacterium]|nr:mechanosensitive ion channel [Verrucomicrobiae bacterium]